MVRGQFFCGIHEIVFKRIATSLRCAELGAYLMSQMLLNLSVLYWCLLIKIGPTLVGLPSMSRGRTKVDKDDEGEQVMRVGNVFVRRCT